MAIEISPPKKTTVIKPDKNTKTISDLVRVKISSDEKMLEPQVSFSLFLLHDPHHLSLSQDGSGSVQFSKFDHFEHNLLVLQPKHVHES